MAASADAVSYHETLAAGWTDRYGSGGFKRRAAFFRAEVLPRLEVSGGEWLDVGCGSGVFSRILADAGASVLGVDGAPAMVEAARGASRAPGLAFEVGRVEDIGGLAAGFDGAICLSVLEYLHDPAAALAAIADRLKPRGRVAFSAPNRASTLRRAQRWGRAVTGGFAYLDSSRNVWTRAELAALARAAGFEVEAILGFDPVAPRPLWALISPSLWFVVARKAG